MTRVDLLRCEYLSDPLGVDTAQPRFSWQLLDSQPVRGRRQSAYQVRIERVTGEQRVSLWDSEKVLTDQSVNVVYDGAPLASAWDCRWRVRVWDENDDPTPWSEEARFVMGLLEEQDWGGQWIRCDQAEEHQHIWFRKSFTLAEAPDSALAYICSIGYHELYVNGRRIGDAVLTPGVTNLAKRALYMTYDISHVLEAGQNVIALWTGPGWARADGSYGKGVWEQTPMFRCHIEMPGTEPLYSDTSWRCAVSSSENIGLWKGGGQGTYGGELIDARRHQPDWNTIGFDDSTWSPAAVGAQSVILSSAMFEPDRKVRTLRPVAIEQCDGGWRIDMGCNYTGWFEINLRGGREGDVVRIQTANRSDQTLEYDQESRYIFGTTGQGTFRHRFNWMAGRWITLLGLPAPPAAEDIRGYIVTNDRKRIGSFECSDPMLNDIYEADLRTYIANTVNGAVMDCPHRERYGYGEVALACSWGCGLPNYESAAFYTKAARDWFDVQDDDGMVNTIAPQPYHGAGGTLWSSAPVTVSWELYRATGDRRLLASAYPVMKRWLDFLNAAVTDEGVLMPYASAARFLGDWAAPHGNEYGNTEPAQLFNNCVYAYNLMVMVKAAEILGHDKERETYEDRLTNLRHNVHARFYDSATGLYGDGRQMSMLFPLYTRVTPEPLRQPVLDAFARDLAEKDYMDTGSPGLPIMLKYLIEDLAQPELLFPCLTRTAYPSYGFFLARGESTWPEDWKVDGIPSRIHTCYTGIAGYFIKGIGGIQAHPDAPGMKQVLIRPCFSKPLTYARTTTASVYGEIVCNWERKGMALLVEVVIPPNAGAQLHLPAAAPENITENEQSLDQAPGVETVRQTDGRTAVGLQAGCYRFRCIERT